MYHHHQHSKSEMDLVSIQSSGEQDTYTRPKLEKTKRHDAPIEHTNHKMKKMNDSSLPPHVLTLREESDVKTFIEQSVAASRRSICKMIGNGRSEDIYERIEGIIAKGAEARKRVSAQCDDNDWASPSRQREMRLEVSRV